MDKKMILAALEENLPGEYVENASMAQNTSFRIGGPADILVTPTTTDKIVAVLELAKEYKAPLLIMGNGSNLLVRDKGIRGMVLKTSALREVVRTDTKVTAGAGMLLGALAQKTAAWGLSGLEFASGIPGTVGGAAVMNAGAYGGEMKQVIMAVTAISPTGQLITIPKDKLDLSYRHSIFQTEPYSGYIITSVEFSLIPKAVEEIKAVIDDYTKRRLTKQPVDLPSAGSMFKRPEGYYAAALIEGAGLKGFQVGGAQVSPKHAGFVVNVGGATAADVLALVKAVQAKVLADKGVALEMEVKIIGEE
jgi:UDP-N-acetylmuramate dehydrogenase